MISTSSVRTRNFYPRPPRGGRPPWHRRTCWPKHISIHALREEGDRHLRKARPAGHEISIHALREEGDWRGTLSSRATQISIHALREEGDRVRRRIGSVLANFYPRPPRGGRHAHSLILPSLSDFYPRPPRGGRLSQMFLQCRLRNFYPRPPRPYSVTFVFLSTPSARRATVTAQRRIEEVRISIHALREEGDSRLSMMRCTSLLFLSTPSARRATVSLLPESFLMVLFLSTPSARRATADATV